MTSLAQPLRLARGLELPNRLAKSAMSERLADPSGAPSEALVRLYQRWARGGAGLLVTGNVMVARDAVAESGNVFIDDARDVDAFAAWARAAKAGGSRVWMQINHPGRQIPRMLSREPVAPSVIEMTGGMRPAFARPRALLDREIHAIVERFGIAARTAERAGFDGVQIHAAHGYLISQFLSPRTNLREDDWGGTVDKRRRFLLEVVGAVRAAVSPGFAVGIKLNSADFQRGGFSEEESMAVVEALEGIDLLEISGGTYEAAVMFGEKKSASTLAREAFFLEYAEKVRARARSPLMLTGGFRTRTGMEAALESGAIDVVGMARPLAAEPDLPRLLLAGEAERATPIALDTGIKVIDAVIQGGWYQQQLNRMGRGLEPDLALSRLRAVVGYAFPPERTKPIARRSAATATAHA
jgi:2,4-dienoyl-CoA reductase-like NADH-dependent reductase (Old Yellow Enzyme family)